MAKDNKTFAKVSLNPVNILIIILVSIFLAEAFITLILSLISPSFTNRYMLLDAGMLAIILFPVIYYLVFRPFSSQIEDLKRSEEALRASEERYRSIVETTDDSIYLVDRNYRYLYMNRKHMARMGFSGEAYVGRCFSEFHSDEETRDFIEKVDIVFERARSGQYGHQSERDSQYFLRTFSPVNGPDGKVVAVSVVSKEIPPGKASGGREKYL
jgi:PAS domain S-box-containing protein